MDNNLFLILLLVWMITDLIAMYRLEKEVKTLKEWVDVLVKKKVDTWGNNKK